MEGTDKGMGNPNTTGEVRCGTILKVAGPLIVATGMSDVEMFDVVRVSEKRLIGEVIELRGDKASIQVYEETAGLGPGEPVYSTGEPLSVELAPGLIESIFDGIQRPLNVIYAEAGDRIPRGIEVPKLDREKKWEFVPVAKIGDKLIGGDVLGTVQETPAVKQKIMMPPRLSGTVEWIYTGEATIVEPIAKVRKEDGTLVDVPMLQRWPVRRRRPTAEKIAPGEPMVTGQRVIDTLFPIAKGGIAAIPGPFGSGKTVVQHQLAKWADADIIVYIGCGERGNEMTDVLREFPELHDPRTGLSLMKRTVLIANTSDMPVAAREASVYTGITIAEYFRDMGYDVAVIADSTSRWAEALREISGRLEEMPAEEGFPAYLPSRLSQFYERAGCVECLGADERRGSLTAIGAVSPPGGDISEPVSQATMRIVKVFWGLDASLAYARHFPAINWLTSYSLYLDTLKGWCDENLGRGFMQNRGRAMALLQKEAELQEIVKLVGQDALSPADNLTLESAKMIREDFLQQNAFLENDQYSSFDRQARLLELILRYKDLCDAAIERGADIWKLYSIAARAAIGRAKTVPADLYRDAYAKIAADMEQQIEEVAKEAEAE